MSLHLRPALEFDLRCLADIFSSGFEGYFVPITESPEGLAARLRYDNIDLALSHVALLDERAVGVIFVAVRGWRCRIAGMGVAAEARRRGVGRRLMEVVVAQCRALGLRRMVLEVIESNEPALALYRDLGFETLRRLVGYDLRARSSQLSAQERRDAAALEAVDPGEVGRRIALEADGDLPWQLAAETFGARGTSLSGAQLHGKAFALVHDQGEGAVALQVLLVPRAERRSGWGRRLFRALASRYDGRDWQVPARVPEGLAEPFLTSLGFTKSTLTQLEMVLRL